MYSVNLKKNAKIL